MSGIFVVYFTRNTKFHYAQASMLLSRSILLQELLCRARMSSGEIVPPDKIVLGKVGSWRKRGHMSVVKLVIFG